MTDADVIFTHYGPQTPAAHLAEQRGLKEDIPKEAVPVLRPFLN